MSKKKTKEEFIKAAKEKHGDKYDYSKVNYVGALTKVCIICTKHGEFEQRPADHIKGKGCPTCGGKMSRKNRSSPKEDFIIKARKVHGEKYDYSKVEYVNNKTKLCIICPEHGEFLQTPSSHLQGKGCQKCGVENRSKKRTLKKEEFIKNGCEKHGDKYDYSKVKYVNARTKVCIICLEHGEFWQRPYSHLGGCGCPECGDNKISDIKTSTKEEFIKKSYFVHGDKYDYTKVDYVNSKTKVCINCSEHGEFWQIPTEHIQGKGCQKCNLSHLERSVINYLDEVGITYDYQKRFDWLGRQSLDFYLPDYNIGVECQGIQHFESVEYFGGNKGFKKTLERDKRKKALCEKHDVKLLYFGDTPNYNTFLGEAVHDDVQYLIDYLNEHKKEKHVMED